MPKIIPRMIGVPWFRREDYTRMIEVSDGDMFNTFEEWEETAERRFQQLLAKGLPLEKVMVDPDDLLAFAESQGARKVNSTIRSAFAGLVIAKKYGRTH